MKHRIGLIAFFFVLFVPAQPQTLERTPPRQRPEGMAGYYLSKINPNDRDYGAQLAEKRSALVGKTVDDVYFWSNVVTLFLLGMLGIWLVLEQRAKNKVEIIASHLIAQLWNGRASDRIEIANRTRRYNEIVDELNEATERKLSAQAVIRKKRVGPAEPSETQMEKPGSIPGASREVAAVKNPEAGRSRDRCRRR